MIYYLKRSLRLKGLESALVSFFSWKNRYAVWLVKSKRTNHILVFRKGSSVWKSTTMGPGLELKKQRRIPYHLKKGSEKVWNNYMNYDWTQLQIHLRGNLSSLNFGTNSIVKTYKDVNRRLKYTMYGFRWWFKRAMRKLRKKIKYKLRTKMHSIYKRALAIVYCKPYILLSKRNVVDLLREKWLESKLRKRTERRNLVIRLVRDWMLKLSDKKNKTWYFYHSELQSALRNGVIIHSLSDYTSHPFGGKRYRKRNIIR
jgi:hypothetical protein